MAGFKVHGSSGMLLGGGVLLLSVWQRDYFQLYNYPEDPISHLLLFLSATTGALSPDVDSDTSRTSRYFFVILTVFGAFMGGMHLFTQGYPHWITALVALGMVSLIWLILKPLFAKVTRHRGVFHTIPMGLLLGSFLAIFSAVEYRFLIGATFFMGFILHLFIDELYAAVKIKGFSIRTKRSFGTAMKWFAPSWPANILLNGTLVILFYFYPERLIDQFLLLF